MKKVYIAGPITGVENYKNVFTEAENVYINSGWAVMNPSVLNPGFEHEEYMKVCYSMIDVCDYVCFLPGWEKSKGACMEHGYATAKGKKLGYSIPMED